MSIWNKTKNWYPREPKVQSPQLDYLHYCQTCGTIVIFKADNTPFCAKCGDTVAVKKHNNEDIPHPVEEAYQAEKQYQCENCTNGIELTGQYPDYESIINQYETCPCCNGNWQDCQNCKPVTPKDIAVKAARYNVEHATPANKAWAEKRLQEELAK